MIWWENFWGVFRIAKAEPFYFGCFILVNLVFGALGLWLPPALALQDFSASPWVEFLKAIKAGNGYLFSLALLAASSMYVVREYWESKNSEFKQIKLISLIVSLGLMVVMALFLSPCISAQLDLPTSSQGHAIRAPISDISLWIQGALTVLSLIWAVFLFCLEMIDDHQEYGQGFKDKTRHKLIKEMNESAGSSELKL